MIKQKKYIFGFKVNKMFWVTFHTAKHYFWTILPVDYLVKMGRMDKEQTLFEQITLSDFKKWSTTALQTLSQFWEKFWKPKALLKCPKMFFTLNTLLVLILTFLSWIFSHVEKRLDQKNKVNFKIYEVTTWLKSNCNCNTHIDQYLKK